MKKLSPLYISEFRDLMNYSDYGYRNFSNLNGKDDWGRICSLMDWIEAWVNEIEDINTNKNNRHKDTINIAQFILGIDTIVSAIKHLTDYFNINNKDLLTSKNIFTKEYFTNETDYNYFKKIRTTCAIHPYDIHAGNGKKYYAGWIVNDFIDDQNFNIFIYHDLFGNRDICLIVKKIELLLFAKAWNNKIIELNNHLYQIISPNFPKRR
ncbi:hypothetical protein FIU87_05515 [Bacillus sp. THAF10]|uniref:hypothetical protein n=1 Tax=Bacillus sp. THAF10 TaxID=2587848 RepID=UPI001268F629|nr:hypothetical protein [Bacillus sp. THAF10]QFT88090.1 hypothetical protein FIU87_05515 [Bacillus sp. THAF10]